MNAAAERDPAPVPSRYTLPAKRTEGGQHMAASPGKEKARFPFTPISTG